MNDAPLCINCKHEFKIWVISYCDLRLSLVNGKPDTSCSVMRLSFGECGLKGQLFEPKTPTPDTKVESTLTQKLTSWWKSFFINIKSKWK
jgi:hypothetical protein